MSDTVERQRAARADLVAALRHEILGPAGGEDEVLTSRERPLLRYLVGRLAPAGTSVAADEDDSASDAGSAEDDADTGYAPPVTMAMNPSSIGLSFITEPGVKSLEITLRWGRYEPEQRQETDSEGNVRNHKVYCRNQRHQVIQLDPRMAGPEPRILESGVRAEFLVRPRPDGRTAISVFLVNRTESRNPQWPDDEEWLFQPEIRVRDVDSNPVFSARSLEDIGWTDDPDLLANELLYWNRPEFAVGHGCSADWTAEVGARTPATEVRTEIVPTYELPRVDPRESDDPGLNMRALGGTGSDGVAGSELRRMLTPIAEQYEEWIAVRLEGELLPQVPESLREQASDHIDACRNALRRLNEGIELVATNADARRAFCFANRAMALQRERTVKAQSRRRGQPGPERIVTRWRPFQLAFILLNLPAMAARHHPDRNVADLLWFPTGGGKTEAYLGLTAFALAHRRLRPALPDHRNDVGVTVLMRYTLRLLTIQQFQRATALICACEHLRENEQDWGSERFSIGLWVGQSATPNSYAGDDGAKEALERLEQGHRPRKGSPVQLLHCPWCGAPLTGKEAGGSIEKPLPGTYISDDDTETVSIFCSDQSCDFSARNSEGGIPAHTVDRQIYRLLPSLVIATVDKFAQMPFNGRIQALFGRVNRFCPRHGFLTAGEPKHPTSHRESRSAPAAAVTPTEAADPPDLIIQDELHLISGPLGTLVGLYETAVDLLSSASDEDGSTTPKVIASTATIRRSDQQIGAIFQRRSAVFPPPGIESTDSWFGTEIPVTDSPGRLYVGVSAPGKSVKTAQVRVYSALLSRAQAVRESDASAADPYMTLVGYFNSLRELGGTLRLVEDDVPGRIKVLNRRDASVWPARPLYERVELTSNTKAEQIPQILDRLERRFGAEPPKSGQYPIDAILASNMISVGVDIDRLGLMVVNGQPKTTAEYIQATSRVGRTPPGLVVTVYNWTRPRDMSHFERFRSYHAALYRFVEATSVTPFSSRARDKGLEGVLTGLIRLGDFAMTGEQNAAALSRNGGWVLKVVDRIAKRAGLVTGETETEVRTKEELHADLDKWGLVAKPDLLSYSYRGLGKPDTRDPDKRYLVDSQENRTRDGVFLAPGSLREVEQEVHVYLLDQLAIGDEDD